MKKLLYIILPVFIALNCSFADEKIVSISEGSKTAKVKIIVYKLVNKIKYFYSTMIIHKI